MTDDGVTGVMLLVGGLMVLMPMLFAGALLGMLWYKNRKKGDGADNGGERPAIHGTG